MLFNSIHYVVFFAASVATYYALPHKFRWLFLLAASYFFYSFWNPKYLVLIVASTAVDYIVGLILDGTSGRRGRAGLLLVSLTCNLGLLFTFKYYNFAVDVARTLLGWTGMVIHPPELQFLLPVGISFYTFQTLSYTLDVYRGKRRAEKHIGIFALYVAFFPQLVAGPIERSYQLLPQFFERHKLDYTLAVSGLRLILWGMFKKIVVADNLATVVDACYSTSTNALGPVTIVGTLFFAYQIYCDFSGYSDIAIGSARVLGFDLMNNFDRPYHAESIVDFWRRWHISLSTWFRDYVYIPLGGNRVSTLRWAVNIAIVFVLSGAWHGANLTFVVWGALHATYYLGEAGIEHRAAKSPAPIKVVQTPRIVRILVIFALTSFAWIFFRADSITHAGYLVASLGAGWGRFDSLSEIQLNLDSLGIGLDQVLWCAGFILALEAIEWRQIPGLAPRILNLEGPVPRWSAYLGLTLAIWNLGATREITFIYFQF